MTPNARLAGAALAHLAGLGVRDYLVCAGARNAPLVSSLLSVSQGSGWNVRHHFDERSAAFFAMGLAKKSGSPVAILTTSGTAVAELLPATVEAYYSGIPLVLVTADRPGAYRGSGAPQAIEQPGIFGPYAPVALDIAEANDFAGVPDWARNAPLHLNLCFAEPAPGDQCEAVDEVNIALPALSEIPADEITGFLKSADRLVVILGELPGNWQAAVEKFLAALGAPVWAEATSGLRESRALADQLIRAEALVAKLAPRQILRLGGVPSLRFWRDLESLSDVDVLSVSPQPFSGLSRASQHLIGNTFPDDITETKQGWVEDLTLLNDARLEEALTKHSFSEPAMVGELSRQIPSDSLVFLGNSLPIREWNLAASREVPHPRTYASRGANGIDGQIATWLGMSEGEAESWGIFGDLTALCDLNAPALLEQLSAGRRRLVILNNAGGRIFSRLSSMAALPESHKLVTENRHARHFEKWAAMWDLDYVRWSAGEPFPEIAGDTVVIEVMLDNVATEAFWEARR
jgi:2-succinyl-5-enolpyruvyl-6-hydroxy-3-cyclohexene-1-carboxylate synthase